MDRVKSSGATVDNKFTDGDPAQNIPATTLEEKWHNDVQEEICAVIENAGISLDPADQTQLLQALMALFNSNTSAANLAINGALDDWFSGMGVVQINDSAALSCDDASGDLALTINAYRNADGVWVEKWPNPSLTPVQLRLSGGALSFYIGSVGGGGSITWLLQFEYSENESLLLSPVRHRGASVAHYIEDIDAAVDEKIWRLLTDAGVMALQTLNDDESIVSNTITLTRSALGIAVNLVADSFRVSTDNGVTFSDVLLDNSGAQAGVVGGRQYIEENYGKFPTPFTYSSSSGPAGGIWASIGPTGSGASYIWPTLDNVPANAKAVLLAVELATSSGAFHLKRGDAPVPSDGRRTMAFIEDYTQGLGYITVPINELNRFDIKIYYGNSSASSYIYLCGWIK